MPKNCQCDGSGRIPLDGLPGEKSKTYVYCPCSYGRLHLAVRR